jgi:hypothetical protein
MRKSLHKKLSVFYQSIDKSPGYGPNQDCWKWTGSILGKYGVFYKTIGYRTHLAHRISFYLHNGIPENTTKIFVLHSCDMPLCVNPSHLREGTHLENMQDAINRKRLFTTHNGRLTEKLVSRLRFSYPYYKISVRQLASNLKIDYDTLLCAMMGKSFAFLPGAIPRLIKGRGYGRATKLTKKLVVEIRKLKSEGISSREIKDRLNLTCTTKYITSICSATYRRWKGI